MTYEKLLKDAGLTINETKVYLTLLKIGKSQTGKIIKKSKIASGKVYETLGKLIDKGLVEVVIKNGVKQFIASDPESILLYMEEKKNNIIKQTKDLTNILPELKKIREMEIPTEGVYLIKGFRGIKPIVYNALKKSKKHIKIMGVRSRKDQKYNLFWRQWHNERTGLKKKAQMLFTDKNTSYWKFIQTLKYTEVRHNQGVSPSSMMIIDNNSFIFSYEKEVTCIHIISEDIAKSFSLFFENLWGTGKK